MRKGAERERRKEADRQNRQTGNEIPSMAARDFAAKHATRTRAAKRESARQRERVRELPCNAATLTLTETTKREKVSERETLQRLRLLPGERARNLDLLAASVLA